MALINSDEFARTSHENGGEELKDYEVEINGIATTLRLTDADALRRGLRKPRKGEEVDEEAVPVADGPPVELKEYTIETESGIEATVALTDADAEARGLKDTPKSKQKAAPANKAAAPENKAAEPSKRDQIAAQSFGQAKPKGDA
jgi:hypothetical protein